MTTICRNGPRRREPDNPRVSNGTYGASASMRRCVPSITDGLIDRGSQTKTDGSMDGIPIWRPLWRTDCEEVSRLTKRFQTKAERTSAAPNSRSPRVADRVRVVGYIGCFEVEARRSQYPRFHVHVLSLGGCGRNSSEMKEGLGPALVQRFELRQH